MPTNPELPACPGTLPDKHKHKKGVNCVAKFSQVSGNRLRPCSDRVFVTSPEQKYSKNKQKINGVKTRFLYGNTSNPTEVKNHDLPL